MLLASSNILLNSFTLSLVSSKGLRYTHPINTNRMPLSLLEIFSHRFSINKRIGCEANFYGMEVVSNKDTDTPLATGTKVC